MQWAERLRTNRPSVAEVYGCIAGFTDLQPSGYINPFLWRANMPGAAWAGR